MKTVSYLISILSLFLIVACFDSEENTIEDYNSYEEIYDSTLLEHSKPIKHGSYITKTFDADSGQDYLIKYSLSSETKSSGAFDAKLCYFISPLGDTVEISNSYVYSAHQDGACTIEAHARLSFLFPDTITDLICEIEVYTINSTLTALNGTWYLDSLYNRVDDRVSTFKCDNINKALGYFVFANDSLTIYRWGQQYIDYLQEYYCQLYRTKDFSFSSSLFENRKYKLSPTLDTLIITAQTSYHKEEFCYVKANVDFSTLEPVYQQPFEEVLSKLEGKWYLSKVEEKVEDYTFYLKTFSANTCTSILIFSDTTITDSYFYNWELGNKYGTPNSFKINFYDYSWSTDSNTISFYLVDGDYLHVFSYEKFENEFPPKHWKEQIDISQISSNFTLSENTIKELELYKGDTVWFSINVPQDDYYNLHITSHNKFCDFMLCIFDSTGSKISYPNKNSLGADLKSSTQYTGALWGNSLVDYGKLDLEFSK